MCQSLLALAGSSVVGSVLAPAIPVEPEAIAVYVLLLVFFWLIWMGNRQGASATDETASPSAGSDAESPPAAVDDDAPTTAVRSRETGSKKLTRAERRRRGHIDWVQ